jgi:hypothetical protein
MARRQIEMMQRETTLNHSSCSFVCLVYARSVLDADDVFDHLEKSSYRFRIYFRINQQGAGNKLHPRIY